ncbi:lipopolysaccharide biosynthesis protein [Neobacillus kokaensis]|uniref:Sugar translocase n=1 Tax=Neobacillus kokaensis TaxID=2759023 RepID=A0ABQ3N1U9_9BACI|nr:oligosaccharide flippase family protein [Neobacillus kokaensis]GHH98657.1 sugar translocase [Neobacillus kokaensis]
MKDSRIRNTLRNLTFGVFNQITTLLLNFFNRTIFIKVLGVEYLGISGLFTDLLMMLSLADLGFGTAMVYSFYKPLSDNDHNKVGSLIRFYKKMYSYIALAVASIGLAIFPFLDYIVKLDVPIPYLKIYYLIFLGNTVVSYLFVYKTSIINADQKNYLISKYQMWVNCGRILFQVLFLLITKNYFVYLVIQLLATFINNLIASNKADKLYPYIKESAFELSKTERKNIFENIKSVFIYKISGVLLNSTDNILISTMIGTVWVGLYSNYNLIIVAISNFIHILYSSATSSIGNVVITEKPKKRYEIFQSMQTISLVISSFVTVCLFVLFNDLIYVWLGTKYILDTFILVSIVLNFYLGSVLHPIWSYREATGLFVQTKYIMLIAAIENIFLSVIMGQYLGMAGILYASAISRLTTYFWYETKLLFKNYFEEKVRKYYIPLFFNMLFTIILITIIMQVSKYYLIDCWYKLIIKATLVGIVTLIAVVLIYRKTIGFKMLVNKIRRIYVSSDSN